MTHKITWDNEEKTVILQEYLDGATKDDLYLLAKESAEMLATVDHEVHIIIDERKIYLDLSSADMRYLEKNVPPNQGHVILIPPSGTIFYKKMMQRVGHSLAPKAFNEPSFARSVEEARELLQKELAIKYP